MGRPKSIVKKQPYIRKEIYSIDEVFIDATSYLSHYNMTAHDLAMTMIREVLYTTGITATAGIGISGAHACACEGYGTALCQVRKIRTIVDLIGTTQFQISAGHYDGLERFGRLCLQNRIPAVAGALAAVLAVVREDTDASASLEKPVFYRSK